MKIAGTKYLKSCSEQYGDPACVISRSIAEYGEGRGAQIAVLFSLNLCRAVVGATVISPIFSMMLLFAVRECEGIVPFNNGRHGIGRYLETQHKRVLSANELKSPRQSTSKVVSHYSR